MKQQTPITELILQLKDQIKEIKENLSKNKIPKLSSQQKEGLFSGSDKDLKTILEDILKL